MYFGSARFYKHLIILLVIILTLGVLVGIGFLATKVTTAFLSRSDAPVSTEVGAPAEIRGDDRFASLKVAPPSARAPILEKTVYLTFTEGPSAMTQEILDVLEQYQVKATFFEAAPQTEAEQAILSEIVKKGHGLGISPDKKPSADLYKTIDSFLERFQTVSQKIEEATGTAPHFFRFPGGSVNRFNTAEGEALCAEMTKRGYTYFDWNVSCGDRLPDANSQQVAEAVIAQVPLQTMPVVLLHDGGHSDVTLDALPEIIRQLTEAGYTFAPLSQAAASVEICR